MEKDKIDLNVPYASLPTIEEQTNTSVEEVAPIIKEEEGTQEESVEETKVPYSRFKNVHSRATEAEREAAYWKTQYESYTPPQQQAAKSDVPQYWIKLYGDSPESLEGWKIQSEANEELKEAAKREAREELRNERYEEAERIDYNLETIDENLDRLSAYVGRDLTEKEQSTILDIVDEYTPQDNFGNYLGAVLPFEKAWEIYELKNTASKAPTRQARDSVAALSSQNTQGETDITEKDKNWNPLDWGAYKRRI